MEQIRLLRKEEIECRVGTINENGLSLLLYKDARVDMKILDEVYGVLNWQRQHEIVGGNLYCIVSIWDKEKGQWVQKMDVGSESYNDKVKGAASDSFKRACFSIGIGRELYTAPFIWVPASKIKIQRRNDKYFTNDKFSVKEISYNENREIVELEIVNQDRRVVYALRDNASDRRGKTEDPEKDTCNVKLVAHLTQQEKTEAINKELIRTGVALDTVLKRYGVGGIEEMTDAVYQNAINSLKKSKDRKKVA